MVAGEVSGSTVSKPWLSFSPKGVVATIWRSVHPDSSYDVYSTLSRDGGKSFSPALRISHASSPPLILSRGMLGFGDDISHVALDDNNVHMVWGDNRAGFLGSWYGRVPISAYPQGR